MLKAIDFFCGIGGVTYGFRSAGINVLAGVDVDSSCKETYEYNNPGSAFINSDITNMSFEELSNKTGVQRYDDEMVFVGCSPCQFWTIINTVKDKSEKSKNLLEDFQKFVDYFRPGHIVIENVPGIFRKRNENVLGRFIYFLDKNEYKYKDKVVLTSHYGIPQSRKRYLLIASRINDSVNLPSINQNDVPTIRKFIGEENGFPKIKAGHLDPTPFKHTCANLSSDNLKRIKLTPHDGGSRLSWQNTELQLDCYKGKDNSFNDIYGRMSWDKPAPTITTKFYSLSNGRFGHPDEDRAISLREGATLQTFPKDFVFFETSIGTTARHIGNAVPPELARRIGLSIIEDFNNG